MNTDDIHPIIVVSSIFAVLGFALGAAFGSSQCKEYFNQEAIRNNHAVWSTDKDGRPVFQWKEASK